MCGGRNDLRLNPQRQNLIEISRVAQKRAPLLAPDSHEKELEGLD